LSIYSDNDEAQLVRNLAGGNLLAFNSLFKNYSSRLYRFAVGYLKSADEAEELVQEVFTIIWEKRSDLKEGYSFRSYIFTIAFNLIRKNFRSRKYLAEYMNSGIKEDLDLQTSDTISYDSLFQYVSDLVEKLPMKRREIFIKSRYEGYSIREISDELKLSHKTVENQISSALKFLREELRKEDIALVLFFFLFIS
jgi:RNA polymerase sigma-70 factor (family 1)